MTTPEVEYVDKGRTGGLAVEMETGRWDKVRQDKRRCAYCNARNRTAEHAGERCCEFDDGRAEVKLKLPELKLAEYIPRGLGPDSEVFTIWFFTPNKRWLDVIEVALAADGAGGGRVRAEVHAFSAAIAPASAPFALLASVALCIFPFGDMGQTATHCRTLRRHLERKGLPAEVCPDGAGKAR